MSLHRTTLARTAGYLGLCAFALAATFQGSWILCIGADGHVAIETNCARCCEASTGAGEAGGGQNEHAIERPCEHCTDFTLHLSSADPSNAQTTFPGAPANLHAAAPGSPATPAVLSPDLLPCSSPIFPFGPAAPGFLAHLRTVVLRC